MFVDFFIHRPVFATVCALLIILGGAVCIPTLPIELYPSLAPPQVLVCVGEKARALELLHAAGRFGVTVLREDQQAFSDYFAYGPQDPAEGARIGVHFRTSARGTTLLDGGLATLDCKVVTANLSGDHTVFIGEVEEMSWTEGKPLLYFAGQYRKLES